MGRPEVRLTPDIGKTILEWCNAGIEVSIDEVSARIGDTKSIQELLDLYKDFPQFRDLLKPDFEQRKGELLALNDSHNNLSSPKSSSNGKSI
jgi:hypothetical protein